MSSNIQCRKCKFYIPYYSKGLFNFYIERQGKCKKLNKAVCENNNCEFWKKSNYKPNIELLKNGNLKNKHKYSMREIDNMTPAQFEIFVAELFNNLGYQAESTKLSGDQGVDVIAKKGNQTLAIQAKHYNQTVGNHAIMEVVGGAKMYNATLCYVVTNNYFTKSAKELAAANNVILWDRDKLIEKLSEF